jgi:hypothetical protein
MMKAKHLTTALALAAGLAAAPAMAGKPVDGSGLPFGNGFPSGEHYNLNVIGKKAGFSCPEQAVDEYGVPTYGKVIFFPREQGNDPITILIESGSKGPRGAPATSTLEVTDWCTESFADAGASAGDPASFRLPANANGYAVYARITGKPGDDGEPTVTFNQGGFEYVQDEAGNDLILLGTFKEGSTTLYRTGESTSTASKGVRKATDITALFQWSGLVCSVATELTTDPTSLCCQTDATGAYVNCQLPDEFGACPVEGDYLLVEADCTEYADPTWVFNIADYVGYLWDLDTTGAFVVQVRFYPIK